MHISMSIPAVASTAPIDSNEGSRYAGGEPATMAGKASTRAQGEQGAEGVMPNAE